MRQAETKPQTHFALCVRKGEDDDLELRKAYPVLPAAAGEAGFLRVIDDSGEDYLYPADYFLALQLPQSIEQALKAA